MAKKKSNTLSVLITWMALLPILYIAQAGLSVMPLGYPGHGLQLPLATLTNLVGLATCAFLGLEYSSNFMTNAQLPKGEGSVHRMETFKLMTYVWMGYMLLSILLASFFQGSYPVNEATLLAGTVMLAYVSGQKTVKLSTSMGPPPAAPPVQNAPSSVQSPQTKTNESSGR